MDIQIRSRAGDTDVQPAPFFIGTALKIVQQHIHAVKLPAAISEKAIKFRPLV